MDQSAVGDFHIPLRRKTRPKLIFISRVLCIVSRLIFIFVRRLALTRYREKPKAGDETGYTWCVRINRTASSVGTFVRRLTKIVRCSLKDTSSFENVHPIHRQKRRFHSWKQCWNLCEYKLLGYDLPNVVQSSKMITFAVVFGFSEKKTVVRSRI